MQNSVDVLGLVNLNVKTALLPFLLGPQEGTVIHIYRCRTLFNILDNYGAVPAVVSLLVLRLLDSIQYLCSQSSSTLTFASFSLCSH